MIDLQVCSVDDVVDTLIETMKGFYELEEIDPTIESNLDSYLEIIKDECYYVIESPYVDKLYRDSYYQFYSSKHREYSRDSLRISVFSDEISFDDLWDVTQRDKLISLYRGFFIIRPTFPNVIGRSFIDKSALNDTNYYTCHTTLETSLNGLKLKVKGFPHARQNRENMSCAETSLWVLMEYFSERYSYYKSVLPSEIINKLNIISDERLLPSQGLNASQIAYTLKEFGFGSKSYSRDSFGDLSAIMLLYIESGIPFIANLDNHNFIENEVSDEDPIGHAVVVCGKEKIELNTASWNTASDGRFHTEEIERKVLVMDDNQSPYRLINLKQPYADSEDPKLRHFEFSSIIVPLYPKIYLEGVQAKALAMSIVNDENLGYSYPKETVFRFLLSSSRSFKGHINGLPDLNSDIKILTLSTPMPKFVWILEIYECKEALMEEVSCGFVVIDATEVNKNSSDSLLIASYIDKTITFAEGKLLPLELNLEGYRLFTNNLS
jgi:hypothetical protein